jgi:hypothetical protein
MSIASAFFRLPSACGRRAVAAVLMLGAWSIGCSPKIGDACTSSAKCSVNGDRLCDPTQPDGYCTIFNCQPGGCPDEAICVAFNETSCANVARSARILRTFCMVTCDDDGDCRAGYYCKEIGAGDPAMQIVDPDPPKGRVCAVRPNGPQNSMVFIDAAVCQPGDGSLPPLEDASPDADSSRAGLDAEPDADSSRDGSDASAPD